MKKTATWSMLRKEILADSEVKKAYDDLELEFSLLAQVIQLRSKKGISQSELAKKMGTTQSSLARFESGQGSPTLRFIKKLANALESPVSIHLGSS